MIRFLVDTYSLGYFTYNYMFTFSCPSKLSALKILLQNVVYSDERGPSRLSIF